MRAPGDWISRFRACVRGLGVGGAAALALMLGGCAAERPVPVEGETPAAAALTSAPPSARVIPTPAPATAATVALPVKLPPPVVMPGGGTRIDMRGSGKHTRALERQPDGSFKQVCVDVPEIGRPAR